MLDTLSANARTLAASVVSSILIGGVVYALGTADHGPLHGRIAALTAEIDSLRAAQASADQRLSDGDTRQKAAALHLDEIAARLAAVEKALTPPPVAAAPPAEADTQPPGAAPEPPAKSTP
ncbi:MAG: hypothetical protein EPN20_12325 [Magnetospirillum sp.]|nr:MAG: hypothetical protein EPN20_12325 [Magnetospirillum sp.]